MIDIYRKEDKTMENSANTMTIEELQEMHDKLGLIFLCEDGRITCIDKETRDGN